MFEILRVVGARLVGDAEIRAKDGGPELGDEFLDRVGVIAKVLAELPIAAALVAGEMRQLMQQRRIVGLGRRARARV